MAKLPASAIEEPLTTVLTRVLIKLLVRGPLPPLTIMPPPNLPIESPETIGPQQLIGTKVPSLSALDSN